MVGGGIREREIRSLLTPDDAAGKRDNDVVRIQTGLVSPTAWRGYMEE